MRTIIAWLLCRVDTILSRHQGRWMAYQTCKYMLAYQNKPWEITLFSKKHWRTCFFFLPNSSDHRTVISPAQEPEHKPPSYSYRMQNSTNPHAPILPSQSVWTTGTTHTHTHVCHLQKNTRNTNVPFSFCWNWRKKIYRWFFFSSSPQCSHTNTHTHTQRETQRANVPFPRLVSAPSPRLTGLSTNDPRSQAHTHSGILRNAQQRPISTCIAVAILRF